MRALLLALVVLGCRDTANHDKPAVSASPPPRTGDAASALDAATPAIDAAIAAGPASVLFVRGEKSTVVPIACYLDGKLDGDVERCANAVPAGAEAVSERPRDGSAMGRGKLGARTTIRACGRPTTAFPVEGGTERFMILAVWPVAKETALGYLADAELTADESAQVFALLPAKVQKLADQQAVHRPIDVGTADLDGDAAPERVYAINVGDSFSSADEGLPDHYAYNGIAVRWSGTNKLQLAFDVKNHVMVLRTTDLDGDHRTELVISDNSGYSLYEGTTGALRRFAGPACSRK